VRCVNAIDGSRYVLRDVIFRNSCEISPWRNLSVEDETAAVDEVTLLALSSDVVNGYVERLNY